MQKTQDSPLAGGGNGSNLRKDTRSAEQIREDLEARRRRISSTVTAIDSRVRHALDWRGHVSRHPLAAAGIAATLGAATGALLRRPRRTPLERVAATVEQAVDDLRSRIDDTLVSAAERVRDRPRRGLPSRPLLPAGLAAMVTRATVDFLRDRVSRPKDPHARPYGDARATDANFDCSEDHVRRRNGPGL
jgi:ElaB/YqjD/DUF883 family membrane-anchored ribosome-binding protein